MNKFILIFLFTFNSFACADFPDDSIYQLDSQWKTQHADPFNLYELAGKKVVLGMTYTSCQHTCPTIVSNMQAIERKMPGDQSEVLFVLVSLMPETDTPELLNAYAIKRDLKNWLLLSGDNDNVRDLAMVLNVKYKKVSESEVAHSNLITLLDEKGRVVKRIEGLKMDAEMVTRYLNY